MYLDHIVYPFPPDQSRQAVWDGYYLLPSAELRVHGIESVLHPTPFLPASVWTNVDHNDRFISHLINYYFTWEQPVNSFVQKTAFLDEMKQKSATMYFEEKSAYRFCSPALVNTICAVACVRSPTFVIPL